MRANYNSGVPPGNNSAAPDADDPSSSETSASTSPATSTTRKRILALDVGSRRIGLAVSDALGITAQGLDTLHRKNKRSDMAELHRIVSTYDIGEIVMGNPVQMSGSEGTQSGKIAEFAEQLRQRLGVPVHLWDERLTSAEAHRILDESGQSKDRMQRKGKVDRIAAVLILQSFMESRSTQRGGAGL
jgi:putative Holliday junction resolvase